jgi:hypothetical protein
MVWVLRDESGTGKRRQESSNIMNQIQVFGRKGWDISLPLAEPRMRDSALLMRLFVAARGRAVRAWRLRDFLGRCKHMISRRLGPFFMFFTPFLSHKGLISRRLRGKRGLFESDAEFHEHKLTQSRRVAESQSRRGLRPILRKCSFRTGDGPSHAGREPVDSRIKRSKVGLCGSLSGIKWDYAGRKSAASRLIPDIPAYSRIMSFVIFFSDGGSGGGNGGHGVPRPACRIERRIRRIATDNGT